MADRDWTRGATMSAAITCCCPTHGRAHIIGEAVESYLRQEPCGVETELLILNDCPEQPLACNAPGVRVVNVPLMESVCHKFDAVVEMAEGDWIAWWEDDDISMPWRLRMSVDRSGLCYNYKQNNAWYWNNGAIERLGENLFFGNSFFSRFGYKFSGGAGRNGYPDQTAFNNMHVQRYPGWPHSFTAMETARPEDVFFLYRWAGLEVVHDSGFGGGAMNDAAQRSLTFRERTLANPLFRYGMQRIEPGWKHDYTEQAKEAAQCQQ
jgi:hypothetical protein